MKLSVLQLRELISEVMSEKPLDDATAYKLLTFAFTSRVEAEDVPYIRYQVLPKSVRMHDYDGWLGNMDAGIGKDDLARFGVSPKQLGDWLAAHGARAYKPKRRKRNDPFSGPMGGYD